MDLVPFFGSDLAGGLWGSGGVLSILRSTSSGVRKGFASLLVTAKRV